MKKDKNIFEILKNLTLAEAKIFMALDKLSNKNGYSYITIKSLANKLNLTESETYSNTYNLIKNKHLYFIDLKDKDNNLLERRFYTNKFNFFKDLRKKDSLIPTMKAINDLKEKAKDKNIEKQNEAKKKLEDIKINNLVEQYWENMDNIMYNDIYVKAEERYAMSVNGIKELDSDFQKACFEKLSPIYIKMIIKEEILKDMGKEIPDMFKTDTIPKKLEDKKVPENFSEKINDTWSDMEFYR